MMHAEPGLADTQKLEIPKDLMTALSSGAQPCSTIKLSVALAALSVVSWLFGWSGYVSAFAVLLCNLYLVFVLVEASLRAEQERAHQRLLVDSLVVDRPCHTPACGRALRVPTG